jgi:hypothetical protein
MKVCVNQIISSPLFNEPMRVVTITPGGSKVYVLGLVGTKSQTFRQVNLTVSQIEDLEIIVAHTTTLEEPIPQAGLQAYILGLLRVTTPIWFIHFQSRSPTIS